MSLTASKPPVPPRAATPEEKAAIPVDPLVAVLAGTESSVSWPVDNAVAGAARAWAREEFAAHGMMPADTTDAVLVVGELVADAVRRGARLVEATILARDPYVWLAVRHDAAAAEDADLPPLARLVVSALTAESGRRREDDGRETLWARLRG